MCINSEHYPPDTFFKAYKDKIVKFLWNDRPPKISYSKLVQNYDRLGLKLVDLKTKDISLKAMWPIHWKECNFDEMKWLYHRMPITDTRLWECNIAVRDIQAITRNQGYKEGISAVYSIWKAWAECTYTPTLDQPDEILNANLFGNSLIKQRNLPIFSKFVLHTNIERVLDVFNIVTGKFYTLDKITQMFGNVIDIVTYSGIIAAIPRVWKVILRNHTCTEPVDIDTKVEIYGKNNNPARLFYWSLIKRQYHVATALKQIWSSELSQELSDEQWWNLFPQFLFYVKPSKFRAFQYRLLTKAITTNVQRSKWNSEISPLCHFCKRYPETLLHLFCECETSSKLWTTFQKYFSYILNNSIELNNATIILNNYNGPCKSLINIFIVIMKQYICACKCQDNYPIFMQYVSQNITLQKRLS